MDDEATTVDLIARHGLRFPVGHSADAAAIAHATGAFVSPGLPDLQSTGFVLDPGGRGSGTSSPRSTCSARPAGSAVVSGRAARDPIPAGMTSSAF